MSVKQIVAWSTTHFLLTQNLFLQFMPVVTGCEDERRPSRSPTHCKAQTPFPYTQTGNLREKAGVKVKQRENHTQVSVTTETSHGACFCRPPVQCLI